MEKQDSNGSHDVDIASQIPDKPFSFPSSYLTSRLLEFIFLIQS